MKVLFIHNALKSFVRLDLEILQSAHDVRVLPFAARPQHLAGVADGVAWCDLVYGWWASWHMLYPAVLAARRGKPVVVAGGDYDIVRDPFGKSLGLRLRDQLRWAMGRILFPCIDRFIVHSQYEASLAAAVPYIRPAQVVTLYHGVPDDALGRPVAKDGSVLTVGTVSRRDITRKGLGTFVQAAQRLPGTRFGLIGAWLDDAIGVLRGWNDANVTYAGMAPDAEKYAAMGAASVYVQASYREGFGMALAEAMLFQCAPVVSDRGSLPEVVGDTGLYVPYGDVQATADAIVEAARRQPELGPAARERILSLFPLARRRQGLLQLVEAARDR